jgi:hypothetical protein
MTQSTNWKENHLYKNVIQIILDNRSLAENDPFNLIKKFPEANKLANFLGLTRFENFVNMILDENE